MDEPKMNDSRGADLPFPLLLDPHFELRDALDLRSRFRWRDLVGIGLLRSKADVGGHATEFGGEVLAYDVPVEQCHRSPAHRQQLHTQHIGEGGFAGAFGPADEEDGPGSGGLRDSKKVQSLATDENEWI